MDEYEEMFRELQKRFGVSFSNEEAWSARTVGDLHDLICVKMLPLGPAKGNCPNVDVFLRLRKALKNLEEIDHCQIRADTLLEIMFPVETRIDLWRRIRKSSGLALPILNIIPSHPLIHKFSALYLPIAAVSFFGITFSSIIVIAKPGPISVMCLVGFLAAFILCARWDDLRNLYYAIFPYECRSFRDLIKITADINHSRFTTPKVDSIYTKESLWSGLVDILVENFSCKRESIEGNTRFYEDLNFG